MEESELDLTVVKGITKAIELKRAVRVKIVKVEGPGSVTHASHQALVERV